MPSPYRDLDVRPILKSGGEPFSVIMDTVASLAPGEGLRLFATFKPIPLFQVLGAQGFAPEAREIGGGDWEVTFTPAAIAAAAAPEPAGTGGGGDPWPAAIREIDCRDLPPPEPMVATLAAVELLRAGEVLGAWLPREPRFLFPELEKRGCLWRGAAEPDGSFRMTIRRGGGGTDGRR
jgi:uncharacterized protein (DUF2249 family)